MIPVITPAEARALDAGAEVGIEVLVARAAAAVARTARSMLGGTYGRVVNVIAGPGNNGADGRVAAGLLAERGIVTRIFEVDGCPAVLPPADLVIDAAYGTGFRGTWTPPSVGGVRVLAVDVPSGVDALTGAVTGGCLDAEVTVTFAAAKPGLHVGAGRRAAGRVVVADIGLDPSGASAHVVEADDVARWVRPRGREDHKWSRAVRVVAGSPGMTGAAHLVAAAAQRAGAGIVHLSSPGIDGEGPVEVVRRRVPPFDWDAAVLADLHRFHALVIGPGLGREDHTVPSVTEVVTRAAAPVVVDGDGLFALSWNPDGAPTMLRSRRRPTVLTPHDGEYALLTGAAPGPDRLLAARHLAAETNSVVLLKGPTTVIARPDGRALLVTDGDERLATAGSGDVLAGILGAVLAGGTEAFEAAAAAAWIHAAAAQDGPRVGTVAGDLVAALPSVMGHVRERAAAVTAAGSVVDHP